VAAGTGTFVLTTDTRVDADGVAASSGVHIKTSNCGPPGSSGPGSGPGNGTGGNPSSIRIGILMHWPSRQNVRDGQIPQSEIITLFMQIPLKQK